MMCIKERLKSWWSRFTEKLIRDYGITTSPWNDVDDIDNNRGCIL